MSLMMNLDKTSLDKAKLLINVKGLAEQQSLSQIMGFPLYQDHSVSSLQADKLLFINGADSMQIGIENHIEFYQHVFVNASEECLHVVNKAGHEVHYQQMSLCVDLLSEWLANMS